MAKFPVDSDLDDQIKSLYEGGPGSASPMEVHKPIWRAAELNALSSRRLTLAIENAARAQNRSADQMWWLTAVILFFTVVAAGGTILEGGKVFAWW